MAFLQSFCALILIYLSHISPNQEYHTSVISEFINMGFEIERTVKDNKKVVSTLRYCIVDLNHHNLEQITDL